MNPLADQSSKWFRLLKDGPGQALLKSSSMRGSLIVWVIWLAVQDTNYADSGRASSELEVFLGSRSMANYSWMWWGGWGVPYLPRTYSLCNSKTESVFHALSWLLSCVDDTAFHFWWSLAVLHDELVQRHRPPTRALPLSTSSSYSS